MRQSSLNFEVIFFYNAERLKFSTLKYPIILLTTRRYWIQLMENMSRPTNLNGCNLVVAALDLYLDSLELLGSALYIPSMIVSFVDSLLLSLANNIVFLLLCKFLLCPDGCSAELGEFSSLLVPGPQVSLCPRSTRLHPFHPVYLNDPILQCFFSKNFDWMLGPKFCFYFLS